MRRLLTRVEGRRLLSAIIALAFCLSTILSLLETPSSGRTDTADQGDSTGKGATTVRALALTAHDPILIDGNAGFTNASGVVWGSGTPSDPFVIEGWEIEPFTTTGISITGTDAWFVIRGVHIFNSNMTGSVGVSLWDVHNGSIENSSLTGMQFGVEMTISSQIVLSGCEIPSNDYAVYLLECSDVTVSRCDVIGNDYTGIGVFRCTNVRLAHNNITDLGKGMDLYDSSSVEITNNTIARNWYNGILIGSCSGIVVHNNTFTSDGITLAGTMVSHYDTHDITPDNLVNGEPIYYISNQNDVFVDNIPVGQLIVADSTRVHVYDLEIEDTDSGIQLAYCSVVWIYTCQLSVNSDHGIHAVNSDTVTVWGCTISDNMYGGGLFFEGCSELYLDWNKIYDSGRGVYLYSSSEAYVTNCIIQNQSGWILPSYGIALYESFNVSLNLNVVEGHDVGVWAYYSTYWSNLWSYVRIYNSTIANCSDGVGLHHSDHVSVEDNVVSDCDKGIVADSSSDIRILRNSITENSNGIVVVAAMSYTVEVNHNNFINNTVQASDTSLSNLWDSGYPNGGNYWSDYMGVDLKYGPGQDLNGSDSIGDTPRIISATIADNYPLMLPYLTNRPPIASFTATPGSGDVTTVFSFDASASWDYEGMPGYIEVRWDWESDGTWDTGWSTELTTTHQFLAAGTYNVSLQVRDGNGSISLATVEVEVTEVIPEFGALVIPIMLTLAVVVVAVRRSTRERAAGSRKRP